MNKTSSRLLKIALPVMLENFLQALMGLVDSYMVAQLGLLAISGVAVANQIMTVYQAIFMALAAGTSSFFAQAMAKKDKDLEDLASRQILFLTIFLGVFLGMVSLVGGPYLLRLLGTPTEISRLGATYLAYVGGSVVLLGLTMSLSAMARVKGMLNFPLLVSLWTNLLNLCLSALAIFVFQWGLVGVALATVMSRFLGCLWLWLRLDLFKSWAWTGNLLSSKLLALTLPAVGERLMMRLGDLLTLTLLTGLGTKVIAANSIGESLTQFNYLPALGMATATLILVAEAYGKQELQAGASVLKRAYVLASLMMLLLSGMIYGLGQNWIGFFTADAMVRAGSRIVLFYSFLGSPITAGVLVLTSFWQAVGKSQLPLYATSFGMWVIRIGLGYLLIAQFQLGLTGLWLATILDNLWRLSYLLYYYWKDNVKAGS